MRALPSFFGVACPTNPRDGGHWPTQHETPAILAEGEGLANRSIPKQPEGGLAPMMVHRPSDRTNTPRRRDTPR